jgi:tetratricopeptide (TPR) repeat protein
MIVTRPRPKADGAGANLFSGPTVILLALLLLGLSASGAQGQPRELPRTAQPNRVLTIQGRVSLPEGIPAERVLVTLINSAGVPRQAYTTEQGRYEFSGIEEGRYTLTAESVSDSSLRSERIEAETNTTATGNLIVNLGLRKEAESPGSLNSAAVVTTAEAGQKVPKEAHKAFKEGLRFRSANRPDKALESFTRAVELYPKYYQALAERGDLRVLQRKLEDAAADFAAALKANPQYGPALRGAGYCKLEKREFAEAVKDFEKSVTAQPDNANTYLLLGIAYLELDHRDAARAALFKALSFNTPHELRAYIYLAKLYARERLYAEAAEELHKYLEANPGDPEAASLKAIEAQWRARAASP